MNAGKTLFARMMDFLPWANPGLVKRRSYCASVTHGFSSM